MKNTTIALIIGAISLSSISSMANSYNGYKAQLTTQQQQAQQRKQWYKKQEQLKLQQILLKRKRHQLAEQKRIRLHNERRQQHIRKQQKWKKPQQSRQVRKIAQRGPRLAPASQQRGVNRRLPLEVSNLFKQSKISQQTMGVFVLRIGDRLPMLAYNDDRARAPASVMKLVTTYSALGALGANYRWPTEVYMTGSLKGGTLKGNLIFKGYGAPDFDLPALRTVMRQLRNKGIRNISGNIIFDSSYFQVPKVDAGAFDGKRYASYNAQPEALLFSGKLSKYTVRNVRGRPRIYNPTPAHNIRVVNRIKSVGGRCRGRSRSPHMSISKRGSQHTVTFSGRFSRRCGSRQFNKAITDSPNMMYSSLHRYWKHDVGGYLKTRFIQGRKPARARLLYRHQSAPLRQIISKVNKKSNNLMARQILLTIGARRLGAPSSPRKGEKAVKQWLASQGLNFPELRIENGSGLSRWSRISARHIGELLLHAYNSPNRDFFKQSLAIAAKDGTIRKRFRRSPVAGRGRFKTGSLRDARAIAGYVRGIDGKDYIVSILHNGKAARSRGKKAHDKLIEWAFWHGRPPRKVAAR
ncbi:MAG: D-alanyl-D-alanine carboxypeptidase/D-alanyl-D-alanine-endopeptidase [Thiotrichaceae bacterium]|nr:D-alanyl-D-alanine carboxypeptidase/D-alanyl-D-alanine-endopeptidase [Thiotrichaceae bacterium]